MKIRYFKQNNYHSAVVTLAPYYYYLLIIMNHGSVLRLVQCYHCLAYSHTRDRCPSHSQPQICGHCAATGHGYNECTTTTTHCHFCDMEGHPASARVCPAYKERFLQAIKDVQLDYACYILPIFSTTTSNPPVTKGTNENHPNWDTLQTTLTTSLFTSNSPEEFNNPCLPYLRQELQQ